MCIKNAGYFLALSPVFCFPKRVDVGFLWLPAGRSVVFEIVLLLGGFSLDLIAVQGVYRDTWLSHLNTLTGIFKGRQSFILRRPAQDVLLLSLF